MSTNQERNLDVVRALYDATSKADWTAAELHLTDDFYVTEAGTMPFAGVYHGRGALRELFTEVMTMMDVASLDLQVLTAGGDHVVALLDMVLAADGQARVPIAEIFRFREHKVCEIRPYYFDPRPVIAAVEARRRAEKA